MLARRQARLKNPQCARGGDIDDIGHIGDIGDIGLIGHIGHIGLIGHIGHIRHIRHRVEPGRACRPARQP